MKKKILSAVLCALLVLSMAIAPLSASAEKDGLMTLLKTTVDGGRLREGPSSEYEVICTLDKGEKVFYAGHKSGSFCLVRTAAGEVGYIYSGFLTNYGKVRIDQIYYADAGSVRVYKSASTGSGRVGYLQQNEHVVVLRMTSNWAYVRTLSGFGGYVQLDYLSRLV